jgi:hypothetical protein
MTESKGNEHLRRHLTPLSTGENTSNDGDRLAAIARDDVGAEGGVGGVETPETPMLDEKQKEKEVTWASLPHRRQLIILTLARLSEPLVQTSLQVCLVELAEPISLVRNLMLEVVIYVLSAEILR